MGENQEGWASSVTTSVANITDLVFDGWMIMESAEVWSSLRHSDSGNVRSSNLGFRTPGFGSLLVAVPTTDDPPDPPREIDGIKVIPLEEFLYGILQINNANERISNPI